MIYKFATVADIKAIEKEMPVEDRWSAETVYEQLCQPAIPIRIKRLSVSS
jgi:hypothetical protein